MDFYKKLCFFFLVLIGNTICGMQVSAQGMFSVEGFITNSNGTRIGNVHVVNTQDGNGTTSNTDGLFKINSRPGETIRFTSVGLISSEFRVPLRSNSPIIPAHIIMVEDTIMLDGITFYAWPPDAASLKLAVLAMPAEEKITPDLKLNEITPENRTRDFYYQNSNVPGMMNPGVTYAIKGPFTTLYEQYSKAGKSQRKYESLVFADQRQKIASSRYNAKVVRRITTFKTDKDIQDFMTYCNLSVDFICNSTEYELYKAVHDCLLAYNAIPDNENPQ